MRPEQEVRKRVQEIIQRVLGERLRALDTKLPHQCLNNYRHPLDTRKSVDGEANLQYNRISNESGLPVLQTVGLCMLGSDNPKEWASNVCDDPLDAKICPTYTPIRTASQIRADFKKELQSPEWVQEHLPELQALLWVLEEPSPRLSFWDRLWGFLFRSANLTLPSAPKNPASDLDEFFS